MVKIAAKTGLTAILLSRPCQFWVLRVPNNLCESTRILIIDGGVTLVVSKQKRLQLQSVPLAPNTSLIILVFLCQNARPNPVFVKQRLESNKHASQHQDVRSAFYCQDAKPASNMLLCQNANVKLAFN